MHLTLECSRAHGGGVPMSCTPTECLHTEDMSEFCLEGFQPKLNDLRVDLKANREGSCVGRFCFGSFRIQGLSEVIALPGYTRADTCH